MAGDKVLAAGVVWVKRSSHQWNKINCFVLGCPDIKAGEIAWSIPVYNIAVTSTVLGSRYSKPHATPWGSNPAGP